MQGGQQNYCQLLSFIGTGGTDAGTNVPTSLAIRIAGSDVIEGTFIGGSVGVLSVGQGKGLVGGPAEMAGRIRHSGPGRGSTTGAADRAPALQVDDRTAEIRSHVGVTAMGADDVGDDALVAGPGFIRA